ncbi:MAG: hypothetical protein ABI205_09420, partial [Gemmatimonadaceae bacterium]
MLLRVSGPFGTSVGVSALGVGTSITCVTSLTTLARSLETSGDGFRLGTAAARAALALLVVIAASGLGAPVGAVRKAAAFFGFITHRRFATGL